MTLLGSSLIALAAAYGVAVAGLAAFQQRLQYFPDRRYFSLAQTGLSGGEELRLVTADGETLVAWHFRRTPERPLIIYFHGNGGALVDRVPRFRRFLERGYGLLAVSYRGYGGSTGSPTEEGLMRDGEAAYEAARARYCSERIVLMGASLGTGVAIALAAKHAAAALVLEAPFLSAANVASALPGSALSRYTRAASSESAVKAGQRGGTGRNLCRAFHWPLEFPDVKASGHDALPDTFFLLPYTWGCRTMRGSASGDLMHHLKTGSCVD